MCNKFVKAVLFIYGKIEINVWFVGCSVADLAFFSVLRCFQSLQVRKNTTLKKVRDVFYAHLKCLQCNFREYHVRTKKREMPRRERERGNRIGERWESERVAGTTSPFTGNIVASLPNMSCQPVRLERELGEQVFPCFVHRGRA